MTCLRRLVLNFIEIQQNPPPLCYAEPKDPSTDMIHWLGWIEGPQNSPYADGKFNIAIKFPLDFPFKPPKVKFITSIFHPNISANGDICLDILYSQWSPALSVRSLLISICSLLTDPNPAHGLNKEALQLYRMDKEKYDETAKQWTMMHARNEKDSN